MKTNTVLALLALGCLAIACGRVSVTRQGKQYMPKDTSCQIAFENLSYEEASAKYDLVGMVTFTGSAKATELDAKKKERLRAEACKLGGDAVSLNAGSSSGMAVGMAQYMVWHAKEAASS